MMHEPKPTDTSQAIQAASRRAAAVRLRFDQELTDLITAIHELREAIHGHNLPYGEPPAGQHDEDCHD